ncbi:MAG: class I SAM-dependent methyltransferase [Deltaproteobacteria bacterium]|jgi:ubiquinone/menaquinone biosynthesis C-methylase UbiE
MSPSPSFAERKREVPSDFDAIAPTYDLLTGLNPGYHRHLRLSAERLGCAPDARILDLCCGTGISTEAVQEVYPRAALAGLDASRGMLEVARSKPLLRGVRFVHGDAMDPRGAGLAERFDGILMAYGLRNVPDPDACLVRLHDMLAPGGRLAIHEYSVSGSRRSRAVWGAVCWGIIIPGGAITARTTKIYRYLHDSVQRFDSVHALEARLRRAGFIDVRTEPMDGWQKGILHTFLATRP